MQPLAEMRQKTRSATQWSRVQRKDGDGNAIRVQSIVLCAFNGEIVIDVALEPAISTNPAILNFR
jgi:sulfur-oxidizing protein SoxZ